MAPGNGKDEVKRGDLVRVRWVDVEANPNEDGEEETADVPVMDTVGFFLRWNQGKYCRVLVLSDTIADAGFYGVTVFPEGCVVSIEHAIVVYG